MWDIMASALSLLKTPSNTTVSLLTSVIENWSTLRPSNAVSIKSIQTSVWTHLNYAFALLDANGRITPSSPNDVHDYADLVGLKVQNPSLKTYISVGGCAANGTVFSKMATSSITRQVFISSVQQFLRTYSFDGIDFDWEYPVAPDRGGSSADYANYVLLLRELKTALGSAYESQ